MVIAAISRQREWAFEAFMREFTDSRASTLLVIAVAFCHLSIFGNWTVRNHLIEKCLLIISASKEDIMCQSMKRKVLLLLQVHLLQHTDFKPQHPSRPFAWLSFEAVTCATRSFQGLFGSRQQNITALYWNRAAASLPPPKTHYISFTPQRSAADHCSLCSLLFRSLPTPNKTVWFSKLWLSTKPIEAAGCSTHLKTGLLKKEALVTHWKTLCCKIRN